jgi:elongation factor Ts
MVVERSTDGRAAAMVEINCETDFVAREHDFRNFAADLARITLAGRLVDVQALLAAELAAGETVDARRRALVSKIGEHISVRRTVVLETSGVLGAYVHGTRIGALVALEGGTAALAHDLAMHVAASNPRYISIAQVPPEVVAKEREILTEQTAGKEGKSPEIIAKMIEGRLRKALNEMALLGQPFVKDPDQSVEKLLKGAGATVLRIERFEVGAGIEKKQTDFVAEVMAQVSAAGGH